MGQSPSFPRGGGGFLFGEIFQNTCKYAENAGPQLILVKADGRETGKPGAFPHIRGSFPGADGEAGQE